MSFLDNLFRSMPCPVEARVEARSLLGELITIGIKEDYLSEHPGGAFNAQCRHTRTRKIGERLNEIGGLDLLLWCYAKVKRKAGKVPASHLEYAWSDIGNWQA